jgi:hypothetical protein
MDVALMATSLLPQVFYEVSCSYGRVWLVGMSKSTMCALDKRAANVCVNLDLVGKNVLHSKYDAKKDF